MAKVLLVSVADFVSFSYDDEYTITKMTRMTRAIENMTLMATTKMALMTRSISQMAMMAKE